MKKKKFFIIVLAVLAAISLGLTGCIFEMPQDTDTGVGAGTLIIRNDCFNLPDTIIRVAIRQGSSSGNVIVDETVTIAKGQTRSYSLASGTFVVFIWTDLGWDYDSTINISRGDTRTLTYDDVGFQ